MQINTLASGSTGNCAIISVSGGDQRTTICLDAGIALRTARGFAEQLGHNLANLDAVLLTHRHSDHSANIVAMAGRAAAPLYMHRDVIDCNQKLSRSELNRRNIQQHNIEDRKTFYINDIAVTPIKLPHDAEPTFGFIFEHQGKRAGFFTDLGHADDLVEQGVLADLDELVFESNYDAEMLANGHYPRQLKQRVSSDLGHLSNLQAANAIKEGASARLQKLTLAHLSRKNNAPLIAQQCMQDALNSCGLQHVELLIAPARGPRIETLI
ncbi:MAG: phosphoribosyl 1,2-cyclic phosphodiesterase [Myxococcota bacterium]|jgi:phosphoribosyl 1,2-cyclic phosphodiesterase